MMRGIILSLLLQVYLGLTATGAQAGHLERIQASGKLRVCIWPEYYAITYRDPRTGALSGIDIDLARALAGELGVRISFVDSSFSKLVANMTGDRCDIAMHAVGIRPERAPFMDFSEPYLISGIYAIAARNNAGVREWADIDKPGHVVVVQKGTYMEPVMRQLLRQARLEVVEDFLERQRAVESGRADVFMTDYPYGRRVLDMTNWARLIEPPQPLAPTPYAYAIPKGDAAWLARVNAFVRDVKADGRLGRFAAEHGMDRIVMP